MKCCQRKTSSDCFCGSNNNNKTFVGFFCCAQTQILIQLFLVICVFCLQLSVRLKKCHFDMINPLTSIVLIMSKFANFSPYISHTTRETCTYTYGRIDHNAY